MRQSQQINRTAPHTDRHNLDGTSDTRWMVPTVARAVWQRFRTDSRTIPSTAWRQWGLALGVGFVLTVILSFGLTRLAQSLQDRWLQAWDVQTLLWIASAAPLTFANGITWQSPGDLLFQPIVVIAFVVIAVWFSRPLIA